MSHDVSNKGPCDRDTPRTIHIAVNSSWDHLSAREGGYRIGHPSEMTVRVLEKDTSPPPTPTPAPSSAYSNARAILRLLQRPRLLRLHQRPHLPLRLHQRPHLPLRLHQRPRLLLRLHQRPRLRPPHQGLDRRAGLVRGRHPRLRRPLRLRRLLCPHPLLRRRRPQDQPPGYPNCQAPTAPNTKPNSDANTYAHANPNTYPAAYFDSGTHSNVRAYRRSTHPGTHANHHDSGDSHGHGSTDGGPRRCSDSGTGPAGHRGACASTNATRLGRASDPNNRRCNTAHPQYPGRHCLHSTATHHADNDPGLRHRVCHRRVRVPDIAQAMKRRWRPVCKMGVCRPPVSGPTSSS